MARRVAIVGAALSDIGRVDTKTPFELHYQAASRAIADAGLTKDDIDGFASSGMGMLAPVEIAQLINAVPVRLTGIAPIARAISTAGGVAFIDIDARFMLRRHPGLFVAGEMLDWEAPTGGYLLQACLATGVAAGRGALEWVTHGPG